MADALEDLFPSRSTQILHALRKSAFLALHKAGAVPPPGAKKPEEDEAACPECGGSMASHQMPAKPKVPAKPTSGSEVAAAGATALGEPPADEADAIEALADDMDGDGDVDAEDGAEDPLEELAEGEEEGEEAEGAEGEGEELPPDDGENHGVGDLNEDGSTGSLVEEVTNLERDYYAAKGLHGDGPKAMVVLDRYHRAVRKLVRSLAGGGMPPEGDETAAPAATPPAKGAKPPMGKPAAAPAAAAAKPAAPPMQGGAAQPAAAGKPAVVPAPSKDLPDEEEGEPDPVDPKLKKSMSSFTSFNDDAPVPDAYLSEYFGAFVEEAFKQERLEGANQWRTMTPMDWAHSIMREFVLRLPRNANFRRIAEQINVDKMLIANVLLALNLVKPGGDMVGLDAGNGYGNEPVSMVGYAKSFLQPDHRSAPGRVLAKADLADLAPDAPPENPFARMRKGQEDFARALHPELPSREVTFTESTASRLERENALVRTRMLLNHLTKLG